jgi:hypothetical protein
MRKTLTALAAVATISVATIAAPAPAEARDGWIAGAIIGGIALGALAYHYNYPRAYRGPYAAYAGPVFYGPRCFWERERVLTPFGWRTQRVRYCD